MSKNTKLSSSKNQALECSLCTGKDHAIYNSMQESASFLEDQIAIYKTVHMLLQSVIKVKLCKIGKGFKMGK